jgi:hypothetical protein
VSHKKTIKPIGRSTLGPSFAEQQRKRITLRDHAAAQIRQAENPRIAGSRTYTNAAMREPLPRDTFVPPRDLAKGRA